MSARQKAYGWDAIFAGKPRAPDAPLVRRPNGHKEYGKWGVWADVAREGERAEVRRARAAASKRKEIE